MKKITKVSITALAALSVFVATNQINYSVSADDVTTQSDYAPMQNKIEFYSDLYSGNTITVRLRLHSLDEIDRWGKFDLTYTDKNGKEQSIYSNGNWHVGIAPGGGYVEIQVPWTVPNQSETTLKLTLYKGYNNHDVIENVYTQKVSIQTFKNQYVQRDIKWYYYDNNGTLAKGWQWNLNGNGCEQYFDPNTGEQYKNGYYNIDGHEYYFDKDGNQVRGWQTNLENNNATQYFEKNSGIQAKNGYYQIDGNWYYFDEYGNQVKGWYTNPSNGAIQYFDQNSGIQVKNGYYQIDSNWYYFDKNGNQVRGWRTNPENGAKQYFDDKTGIQFKNGWFEISGQWYEFDSNGNLK